MYSGVQGRSAQSGTSQLGLEAWGLIVGILREAQTPEIFQSNHRDLIPPCSWSLKRAVCSSPVNQEMAMSGRRGKFEKKNSLYCVFAKRQLHYPTGWVGRGLSPPLCNRGTAP